MIIHKLLPWGHVRSHTTFLPEPAALTFIGYKQTDKKKVYIYTSKVYVDRIYDHQKKKITNIHEPIYEKYKIVQFVNLYSTYVLRIDK